MVVSRVLSPREVVLAVLGVSIVIAMGCGGTDSSPLLSSDEHEHFHLHASDVKHDHEHSDFESGHHTHYHDHAEESNETE